MRPENHHCSKQESRQLPGCYLGSKQGKIQTILQTIKHLTLCAQQVKSSAQHHQKYTRISKQETLRNFI